eukprot:gene5311-biopygen23687
MGSFVNTRRPLLQRGSEPHRQGYPVMVYNSLLCVRHLEEVPSLKMYGQPASLPRRVLCKRSALDAKIGGHLLSRMRLLLR